MWRLQKRQNLILLLSAEGKAQNSSLALEVTGEGSGGRETTIAQVEQQARADAMRKALEQAGIQLASVTQVDLGEMTQDEVTAWSRGLVRVIEVLSSKTIFDEKMKAFRCDVRIKVAVDIADMASLMSQVKPIPVDPAAQPLTFEYRFLGFSPGLRGGRASQGLSSGDPVREGQEFQIWFKPDRECYAYVINRDASGAVYVLFPHDQAIANRLVGGQAYTLPEASQAYRFDQITGVETFYLVVSPVEMTDLEWMIRRMGKEGQGATAAMLDGTLRARGVGVVSQRKTQAEALDGQQMEQVTQMLKGNGAMIQIFTLDHR